MSIFVSSTFRDFHAERDYLVKYVFPALRQWCHQYRLHLVDIDLRWGVTEAETESGRVVHICLKNIDGSRPFFLCMLGSRYGWIPPASDIADETHLHYKKLKQRRGCSLTHLEILHAVLDPLAEIDSTDRASHAFFYFRDPTSLPDPNQADGPMAGLPEARRAEFRAAFFETDAQAAASLERLKGDIRDHYGRQSEGALEDHVFSFRPAFDPKLHNPEDETLPGRFTTTSLKDLGERVQRDLRKAISSQFEARIAALSRQAATGPQDQWESERDLQEAFIEHRTRSFVGRTELVNRLQSYAARPEGAVLAVLGAHGSGKSALLSHFYRLLTDADYAAKHRALTTQPRAPGTAAGCFIVPHFVGASPGSTALSGMLARLCGEMKARFGLPGEIPHETDQIASAFQRFLDRCSAPTLLILDALNQLDEADNAHDLAWLPTRLPPNVGIVASTVEGAAWDALRGKTVQVVEVTPLTLVERREIVTRVPAVFCKALDEDAEERLIAKQETENPLYLKVALDELRVFGSHAGLEAKVDSMPGNVVALFVAILDRLEREMAERHGGRKGGLLVERLFCLLECSRFGLEEGELRELMEGYDPNLDHLAIVRQLRDYFFYRGNLLDFFHRALSKAVRRKYFQEAR